MIGESEAIDHIKVDDWVAPTEARVLITGPNGTGTSSAPTTWKKVNELVFH
jgi:DNA-binding NtrC family response regulator